MGSDYIPGTNPVKEKPHYTYKDYKTWGDDIRCELWYGEPVMMSPAPRRRHQKLLLDLALQIKNFLEGKPCQVYLAPLDVFLPEADESLDDCDLVVQPDIMVVCDQNKLIDEGIRGAPDFIIEILSPTTAMRDQSDKKLIYESKGVREYWIANPNTLEVFRYVLQNGRYGLAQPALLTDGAEASIFPELKIRVTRD
jgi:Uma2 family endonuclease